jgi:isopentenyl-diphosphate delta-isomerase
MATGGNQTGVRKRAHLDLFKAGGVPARAATTLLECVHLVHQPLPEIDAADVDACAFFAGRKFSAPFFITGMTGGTREAGVINRCLAQVAERHGLGFGLGSQRAMLENPRLAGTYSVRSVAPSLFLAGNLGGVQAAATPPDRIRTLLERIGADALCIHLNPAQEMLQPEGDRVFRGILKAVKTLVPRLGLPVIVKETGAGFNRRAAEMLRDAGVRHIDVSGLGGTSWTGAEIARRGGAGDPHLLAFWDWGIPTAAAIDELDGLGLEVIGSGGIRTGVDAARAIALGASLAGIAAPVLRAYFKTGEKGVESEVLALIRGLKTAMLLTGSRTLKDLKAADKVITGGLLEWRLQRRAQWVSRSG